MEDILDRTNEFAARQFRAEAAILSEVKADINLAVGRPRRLVVTPGRERRTVIVAL